MIHALLLASPLSPLENVLRALLDWLHGTVGLTWAWSIVGVTVIVRMAMVPLTVRQIHSMQSMQRHMPEMKAIQQKYKQDKKRQQEELMRFYRENNINPAASCLPLLVQLPVFIALYLVLRHFARSHPGGSLSWLHFVPDITAHASAHWSGYVLLAVYAASQVASTYFMSATMDKTQRTLMMLLPLFFITFLLRFPVGLVVYWVTTNLWTVGQGLITRRLVPKTPVGASKRTSRMPPRDDGRRAEAEPEQAPAQAQTQQQRQPQVRRVKRKKKRARR